MLRDSDLFQCFRYAKEVFRVSLLILICFEPIYLDNDLTRSHFSKIYQKKFLIYFNASGMQKRCFGFLF